MRISNDVYDDNGILQTGFDYNYFRNINPNIELGMNTNGSLKPGTYWTLLGAILNQPRDYVVFSIDGLEDTNHLYRVNSEWHRVMENARCFIDAGGSAHWDMLVYKHNEHQVESVKNLGKSLGFLPGSLNEKFDPYMEALLENLNKCCSDKNEVSKLVEEGKVKALPVQFIRGKTIDDILIVEEAQNLTKAEMLAILTRLGKTGKIVINGDNEQTDIKTPTGEINGLSYVIELSKKIEEIKLDEINAQTYAEERVALYDHDKKLIDRASQSVVDLNAKVRPYVAFIFVTELVAINFLSLFWAMYTGVDFITASKEVFSTDEMAIVASIIGFYFGSRTWEKK